MWGSKKYSAPSRAPVRVRTKDYSGPERRHIVRRKQGERRAMVRWEPDQGGRRQNEGRRVTDNRLLYR
ncbi:MAG: hypothetical protein ACYDEV_11410 [Acidiferrobacter sp.]